MVLVAEIDEAATGLATEQAEVDRSAILTELADQIHRQVTRCSNVALRYVQMVARGWLLKTSSGKIARSANRDKYLKEYPPEERM